MSGDREIADIRRRAGLNEAPLAWRDKSPGRLTINGQQESAITKIADSVGLELLASLNRKARELAQKLNAPESIVKALLIGGVAEALNNAMKANGGMGMR